MKLGLKNKKKPDNVKASPRNGGDAVSKFRARGIERQHDGEASDYIKRMGGPAPSWLKTKKADQDALMAQQEVNGASRPPEFWVAAGETKTIRVRHDKALGSFQVYGLRINGRFRNVLMNEDNDIVGQQLGKRPAIRYLYEIVDIDGYTSKKTGESVSNVPRFWLVGQRLNDQIEVIRQRMGGDLSVSDLAVTRTGTGQNTSYTIFAEPAKPMSRAVRKAESLFGKINDFYKIPTADEQKAIVNGADDED